MPEVFCKKGVLRNFAKFTGKQLRQSLFLIKLPQACNFIKKDILAQVFSFEFCEVSKNNFSYRMPLVAASEHLLHRSSFVASYIFLFLYLLSCLIWELSSFQLFELLQLYLMTSGKMYNGSFIFKFSYIVVITWYFRNIVRIVKRILISTM